MLKFSLFFAFVLFLSFTNASARKSDFMMGFSTGFNGLTSNLKDYYNNGMNLGLHAEYMKSDLLAWSFDLDYNSFGGKTEPKSYYDSKIHAGSFSSGIKFYFFNFNKSISPYVGIMGSYNLVIDNHDLKSQYKYTGADSRVTNANSMFGIKPQIGVSFPLSKRFYANFDLSYTFTWINNTSENPATNQTYSNSSLTEYNFWRTGLGFTYNFE